MTEAETIRLLLSFLGLLSFLATGAYWLVSRVWKVYNLVQGTNDRLDALNGSVATVTRRLGEVDIELRVLHATDGARAEILATAAAAAQAVIKAAEIAAATLESKKGN